ncbi:MAG: hypothetical protein ACRDSP_24445 [Pseudonocardiaceae bacterium]
MSLTDDEVEQMLREIRDRLDQLATKAGFGYEPGAETTLTLQNRPTQNAAIAWNGSNTSFAQYAYPGGLVCVGRDNYDAQVFKNVSAAGGTVLVYLDAVIDNPYGRYHQKLHLASEFGPATARWPGNLRANQWGYLADFRVGSTLQNKLEGVLDLIVSENPHIGGFFADDLGSRSWFSGVPWDAASTEDKQSYRDGAIALCRTFRKVCDLHGLVFIVNGTWGGGSLVSAGGGYPAAGRHGCALADGGFVENHPASEINYWRSYCNSPQWASQSPYTLGTAFHWSHNDLDRPGWETYRDSGALAFASHSDRTTAPAPYAKHVTGLPSRVR